jgi:SAM-dependent methyltransferase
MKFPQWLDGARHLKMKIARQLRTLMMSSRNKNKEQIEQYFYFTLPSRPLPLGFSHTDLGCGSRKTKSFLLGYPDREADVGVDVTKEDTQADLVCKLGLEALPIKDNSQELVTAYDFLEHIPKVCVIPQNGELLYIYPTINLFNEIYRILKAGGYFESLVPGIPNYWNGAVRDPTHISFYCIESFDEPLCSMPRGLPRGRMHAVPRGL